ncbi:MAG: B12-binding domain-containing radical SAM protein, partial [bacterium]|nr:B12-binding domain-containing radical SAM protein [bacterium]
IGRWHNDGNIEILGRTDDQLKLRGHRIEIGEIEKTLLEYPPIAECIVTVRERGKKEENTAECKLCGIRSNYPGVIVGPDGYCEICENPGWYKDVLNRYFQTPQNLGNKIKEITKDKNTSHDCILLYSGGRGAAYALYQLVELGLRVLAVTYDNGYFSKTDLNNIKKITSSLGVEHVALTHPHSDNILKESMKVANTVCRGCFQTSSSLAAEYATKMGIKTVVGATLSRGQIIENKLFMFLRQGITDVESLEKESAELQKLARDFDKTMFNYIDLDREIPVFDYGDVRFFDFYRYFDVTNEEMIAYLNNRDSYWKSCKNYAVYSTNCPIKQMGDYGHHQETGYHFYGSATSWEKRLGHLTLDNLRQDLSYRVSRKGYERFLKRIGIKKDTEKNEDERYICTYYISDREVKAAELREWLADKLPDYMIPSYFLQLDRFPLTENAKIDLKGLPEPDVNPGEDYMAPRDETEKKMVEIWKEELGVGIVGINDNFFDLGGHSLKATMLASKVHKELDVKIPLAEIFRTPTILELAEFIRGDVGSDTFHVIEPAPEMPYYQVSSAQKRLY